MTQPNTPIAFALDLTEQDEVLLRYMRDFLSEREELPELYFIHNVKYGMDDDLLEILEEPLTEILAHEVLERAHRYFPEVKASQVKITEHESTVEGVLTAVEHCQAQLLVMGKKLQSDGSGITPLRVLRQNRCHVLLIPESPKPKTTKILVPVDFSKNAGRAMSAAAEIALEKKADIKMVHVYHLPNAYFPFVPVRSMRETMKKKAQKEIQTFVKAHSWSPASFETHIVDGEDRSIVQQLEMEIKIHQIDFLVLAVKGHSQILGSVALGVQQWYNRTPVLFVKSK